MQPKNSSITLFLNFLIPGVGHLYASDGKSWGLLAINIACALTGLLLVIPLLGVAICWVVGLVQSSALTARYNSEALEAQEQKQQDS
jgi:Na+/serine symporter